MSEPTKCPECKTRLKRIGDYKKNDTAGILYNCPKCGKKMVKKNWYGYLIIIKEDSENSIETEKTNKNNPIREEVKPTSKTKPLLVIKHYY